MDRDSSPYYRPLKTDQSSSDYGEINPHRRFQMDAPPYQYESWPPETDQDFVNGAL